MPFEKGNRFWELRSKHGMDKTFQTPEIMWEAACEYFAWVEDNPHYETVVQKIKVDRDTEEIKLVKVPKMRAFTIHDLTSFLGVNTVYFNGFERDLKGKDDEISNEFRKVIMRIREVVYANKFSGAASGFFNANIIARDLGLVERKEIETTDSRLTEEDRKQRIEELKNKLSNRK